jgi:flavorubredoxin/NADPH-dependent 2,4-dienoyl-CoA reductase/sulfur reductase-like enzyme
MINILYRYFIYTDEGGLLMKTVELKTNFFWVGNLDPGLRVFDIIMHTEYGTTYNSYVLKGSEKTVLFETTKIKCFDEYLEKVKSITPIEEIEYIVVNHTEPDHAGSIEMMLKLNPRIKIVGSGIAINFLKEICNCDFTAVPVKDGDKISLGDKTLQFFSVPNLHWPDTIYSYIEEDKILVSCDSFGAHYSLEEVTNDKIINNEDYMKALRYYYDMIIGPFKPFVLKAIKKIELLKIEMIATGHGPVLVENPEEIIKLYKEWSTEVNPNKKKTVIIPYVSAYGYTTILAEKITEGIKAADDIDVRLYDLVTSDVNQVLAELYWADGILLGTPTIVGEALKPIWDLTTSIFAKTHGGKLASAFGSYGWSGEGVPNIIERLKQLKMKVYGEGLRVKFKPNESQLQEAYEFGYNFGKSVIAGKVIEPSPIKENYVWKCVVCGEIVKGVNPPAVCPVCGVGPDQFVKVSETESTFQSTKDESFIIIGNGAAGTTACEEIRKRNKIASVELISAEDYIGYNRPMLTKGILTELDALNFYIKPESWYRENNIRITLGSTVTAIDSKNKELTLSNGMVRSYDKLILATGANSFIPNMEGVKQEGVFAIRSLKDIRLVQEYLNKVEKVVVIGGGILGLETAWEIKKAGKEVTVVQRSHELMDKQLDTKGSMLLREAAEKAGVSISAGIEPIAIEGNGTVTGVRLKDGSTLKAEMVVFSTGIKPNISVAEASGIETNRFIKVNEKMETNIKDIYACGDCAIYNGKSYGIWSQALDMGKTAGANAVGEEIKYEPTIPSNSFNGMGISLFSVGDPGKDPEKKYKSIEIYDAGKNTYEKFYFVNNRFCGGVLIGDVSKSKSLLDAYKNQESVEKFL